MACKSLVHEVVPKPSKRKGTSIWATFTYRNLPRRWDGAHPGGTQSYPATLMHPLSCRVSLPGYPELFEYLPLCDRPEGRNDAGQYDRGKKPFPRPDLVYRSEYCIRTSRWVKHMPPFYPENYPLIGSDSSKISSNWLGHNSPGGGWFA